MPKAAKSTASGGFTGSLVGVMSRALQAELGKVDEAKQQTMAEIIAERAVYYLTTGPIDEVFYSGLMKVADRTEGKPRQTVINTDTSEFAILSQLNADECAWVAIEGRIPTLDEREEINRKAAEGAK